MQDEQAYVDRELRESARSLELVRQDADLLLAIRKAAHAIVSCLRAGGKVLVAGNGGSAADAQHFAAELISRMNHDRPAYAGIALTTDSSALTAIGNDYGYEHVFARQLAGLGRRGDVFVGISTSGGSANILRALETAKAAGLATIGLTGSAPAAMDGLCDFGLKVPAGRTPLIQQLHIVVLHLVCGLVERALDPR